MSSFVSLQSILAPVVQAVSAKMLPIFQASEDKYISQIEGVFFDYGHYPDINEVLQAKGNLIDFKNRKYPLIVLFEDYETTRKRGLTGVSNVTIMILCNSQKEYKREEREQKNFIPILYPIYQEFLRQLKRSGKFMFYGDGSNIPHKQINRPHWGDPAHYGNKAYLFNEPLDGIELSGLELQSYLQICPAAVLA